MKLHKTILMTLGLMAGAILPAGAEVQNLYLSPTGNDANAGTKAAPIATIGEVRNRIERICAAADKPDSVKIIATAGTYPLHSPLVLTPELTRGVPLVFEGDAEGRTVFSGGQTLAPFTRVNDRLWKTYVPDAAGPGFTFEQLYVNGQRRSRAKSPNHGEFHSVRELKEQVMTTGETWQTTWTVLQVEPDSMPCLSQTGAEPPLVTFYHKWSITRRHVLHMDDSVRFYCAGKGQQPWNPINNRSRFIVENDRNLLDASGEWFLDGDGWLYYIPCEGETPENTVCTAPVTDRFLVLQGSEEEGHLENVCFRHIAFEHSGYRTPVTGYDSPQGASEAGAVIEADYARHIRLENCTVAHTGLYGIWFHRGCSDSRVEHCHLYDLGAGGVKIGPQGIPEGREAQLLTHHITVDNCIIQHGGKVFPPAVGVIIFHAADNRITHNDIADFRYTGVSVGWMWGYAHSPSKRNIIEYNHIHHLGWGELSDMGAVYTLGPSEGSSVSHNHVHHVYSLYYGGWGLYTDEGSSGIRLENNLVYRCKSGGFHQHYGKDNIVRNNIFAGQIRTQLEATRVEEHTSFVFENNIVAFDSGTLSGINWEQVGHRSDYNCYFDSRTPEIKFKDISWADWQKKGQDRHSVIADPQFADAARFDFTPTNRQMLKKIGFKPFDPGKAGVYGSDEWQKRAKLSQEILQAFDKRVADYEEMGKTDW